MPKRKTGAAKKREAAKERNKTIAQGSVEQLKQIDDFVKLPSNSTMLCGACGKRQKNRAFCYFCQAIQKNPMCAECGRIKCMSGGGDCLVKHPSSHATGLAFIGCICDFCEAFVCHSRHCVQTHACNCLLRESQDVAAEPVRCYECNRSVHQTGGKYLLCNTCERWCCEDDHFEHQASCLYLNAESYKCISCGRQGMWSCMRCKIAFCDAHVKSKVTTKTSDVHHTCKKCGFKLHETKDLSISTKTHAFGRGAAASAPTTYGYPTNTGAGDAQEQNYTAYESGESEEH
eukprot:gb/GECG01011227.1/.p1 GENE.gb/GECG01011227.1/~~gb/GECG01011227.1/.p1  ORF type:complete len:288 (+),score=24.34 gb/GECG01011227.1/:1-864(+)